jgi:signal peptidase I
MKQKRQKSELREWVEAILITVVIAVLLRSYVFVFAVVDGTSMEDTLNNGDRLLVSKITYHLSEPQYGDIVIINVTQSIDDYVKRIIGKPATLLKLKIVPFIETELL